MTTSTINAFRQLWIDAARPAECRITAREMALEPHSPSKDGNMATCPDGKGFVWVELEKAWIRCR